VKAISPQQNLRKGSRWLTGTRTFLDDAAEMKIYITRNGQRTGPYSLEEVLCIGYLMVAFTERKQGLHDMIAGTYVVNEQS
jgi:hypothetical protein